MSIYTFGTQRARNPSSYDSARSKRFFKMISPGDLPILQNGCNKFKLRQALTLINFGKILMPSSDTY